MLPPYIDEAIKGLFTLLLITVPLAIWKLFDIIIWCFEHIKVVYE